MKRDLVIPDGWQDNTINAFSAPALDGGGSANFVITRDAKTGSPDVATHADQHLVESAKKLKGYNLIGRRAQPVDDHPSITVDYTSSTPDRIVVQQRQYVLNGSATPGSSCEVHYVHCNQVRFQAGGLGSALCQ